jgi:hypothetical protein
MQSPAVDGGAVGWYLFTRIRKRPGLDDDSHVVAGRFIERSPRHPYTNRGDAGVGSRPSAPPKSNRTELVTNSNSAASQVRSVALVILSFALAFPFLGTAQDPPANGGQKGKDPPKQEDKKGDDKKGDDKKAEDALKKIKEQKKKEAGEEAPPVVQEKEKAGLARKKLEDVRNNQRFPAPLLSQAERTQIQNGTAKAPLVLKWARYQASLFTDPEQDKNVQKNHDDVVRLVANADQEYAALLKRQMFDVCDQFINKIDEPKISTVCKVNLLSLIDELHPLEPMKEVNAVNVVLDTLRNHERHGDAVLYTAMNVLANAKLLAKANGLLLVEQERIAAGILMKIARRGELQPLLLETLCKTLGIVEVPFEGLVNEAAEVATFLANIATNENLGERTRIEAAVALGRLKKQGLIINYAFDVEAWVLGKTYLAYLNWVVAGRAADPPTIGEPVARYLGARLYDATRRSLEQAAGANGQDRLRTLLSAMEPSLKDVFENKDPDREPIVQWLDQNKVQTLKLARRAAEIRPIAKANANAAAPPQGGAAAANP